MRNINIAGIAAAKELDLNFIAAQLFPNNKHPRLALNRVMAGDGVLDANQISKLSLLSGIEIGDLFTGSNWTQKSKHNVHIFTNNEFTAELNTDIWTTRIYHNDSMFHEQVLHDKHITLSKYLEILHFEITKFNANADFRN